MSKETLVRVVRTYGPDGDSVRNTETIEVEITWPGERPESTTQGYVVHGEWVVSRPTRAPKP